MASMVAKEVVVVPLAEGCLGDGTFKLGDGDMLVRVGEPIVCTVVKEVGRLLLLNGVQRSCTRQLKMGIRHGSSAGVLQRQVLPRK